MTTAARKIPDHGTQSRYRGPRDKSWDPCRCDACTFAHSRACKARSLAHLAGTPPLYPGAPLRQHIQTLTDAGMSWELIARRAPVSHGTIRYLMRGLTNNCRRAQALRILAVRPGHFDPHAERPALGSMRRIRALYAIGHNPQSISEASGIGASTISNIANGHQEIVKPATAAAIHTTYRNLRTKAGTSDAARRRARRNGWHGPLAWDGNIDDPAAVPDTTGAGWDGAARKRDDLRTLEIQHLAGFGYSAHTIAQQVGLPEKDVENRLSKLRAAKTRQATQTQTEDQQAAA